MFYRLRANLMYSEIFFLFTFFASEIVHAVRCWMQCIKININTPFETETTTSTNQYQYQNHLLQFYTYSIQKSLISATHTTLKIQKKKRDKRDKNELIVGQLVHNWQICELLSKNVLQHTELGNGKKNYTNNALRAFR